jgi:hypothetical protein
VNIEETKKAIAVMQAFVDGAEIEYGFPPCFKCGVTKDPTWNWADKTYRSKTEPREIWVNCYAGEDYVAYATPEKAELYRDPLPGATTVKFREVIE